MSEPQPEGRPIAELRRIVKASNDRLERIGEVWINLSDEEQEKIVRLVEGLAEEQP